MLACMLKGVSALARPASNTGLRTTALRASSPLSTFPLSDSTPTVPCSYAGSASDYEGDLLVIPFWQTADDAVVDVGAATTANAWNDELEGLLVDLAAERDFKGAKGSGCLVSVSKKRNGVGKVALYGLGRKDEAEGDAYRGLGAYAAKTAREERAAFVGVAAPSRTRDAWRDVAKVEALVLGCHEANYVDNRFRTGENVKDGTALEKLLLVDEPPDADDAAPDDAYADSLLSETPYEDVEKAGGRAAAIAEGCKLARDLVNAPPNVLTPRTLAIAAVDLAKSHAHLDCTCMGRVECERRGMGAFLGVSQGSSDAHEAQFIHLTYKKGVPRTKLCIVGKGLTYDSGGYNLKPSAGGSIELMKFDMGGSAATLGCAAAVAGLGVDDVEVHFIVAACENMISQDAMRPGDVLTASNGKTIEVINTDAEGRLTLADALVYAEALKPDAIVDLATLTGACVVALGDDVAGLFSKDDALASELEAAASSAMEQVWRMPMPPAYEKDIESTIADLKNVGPRAGGAITAALFLGHFVEDTPHAHVDIAGPVWNGKAGEATGFGVKTMAQWVEARAAVPADAVF